MSKDLEKAVREILEKEGESPVYEAAADILRALLILYGSGWESDLRDVLLGLWSIEGVGLEKMGELQHALPEAEKLLSDAGIIKVERRMRADLSGKPQEEKIYTTGILTTLLRVLASDLKIDRYRYEVSGGVFPPRSL